MRHLVRSRSELQRQLTELVEQRAAISEVLRAVANSPHDLQPIFDTILINATRLCRAKFGGLLLFEEKGFRTFARRGPPNPVYAERWPLGLVNPVGPGDPLANSSKAGRQSTLLTWRPIRLIFGATLASWLWSNWRRFGRTCSCLCARTTS
jgi:hypothetical protein